MTAPAVPLDPAQPIQAGVHQLLSTDAQLVALGVGVWDQVPEPKPYPYVTIRDVLSIPDDTHSSYGQQTTVTIHTWTGARGNEPGNQIGGRLYSLLHQQHAALDPLVVGHVVWKVAWEFRQSLVDPQPDVRHRVDRFRIRTYQQEE